MHNTFSVIDKSKSIRLIWQKYTSEDSFIIEMSVVFSGRSSRNAHHIPYLAFTTGAELEI